MMHAMPTIASSARRSGKALRIFASHDWGVNGATHERVVQLVEVIRQKCGVDAWLDETHMTGNLLDCMTQGIDSSDCMLVFVTRNYMRKTASGDPHDNVRREFMYAQQTMGSDRMIAIKLDENLPRRWTGPVGMQLGSNLYVDMSTQALCDSDATYVQLGKLIRAQGSRPRNALQNAGRKASRMQVACTPLQPSSIPRPPSVDRLARRPTTPRVVQQAAPALEPLATDPTTMHVLASLAEALKQQRPITAPNATRGDVLAPSLPPLRPPSASPKRRIVHSRPAYPKPEERGKGGGDVQDISDSAVGGVAGAAESPCKPTAPSVRQRVHRIAEALEIDDSAMSMHDFISRALSTVGSAHKVDAEGALVDRIARVELDLGLA